jgi:uncharacterized membrane protein YozB (DUF420 family)
MTMPPVLTTIIGPMVVAAPLVAALVIGLVLTVRRRARDPRGALLVVLGLALAFLSPLLGAGLQALTGILVTTHTTFVGVRTVYTVVNVIASVFSAAGWILAAVALIRTRRPAPPAPAVGQVGSRP